MSMLSALDGSFEDIISKNPQRQITIYRYEVVNFNTTLRKTILVPRKNTLMILSNQKALKVTIDTYQEQKITKTINSNSNPGRARTLRGMNLSVISNEVFPTDYENKFYIYSLKLLSIGAHINLNEEEWFLDDIGTFMIPQQQEKVDPQSLRTSAKPKIINILNLKNAVLFNNVINSKHSYYYDASILGAKISPTSGLSVSLKGGLLELEALGIDNSNNLNQIEYALDQQTKKYACFGITPAKIEPNISFSSRTFNNDTNLRWDIAKKFTQSSSFSSLFVGTSEVNVNTDGKPEFDLKWLFNSIIWISLNYPTGFKKYLVQDSASQNFGQIDIKQIDPFIYGITIFDVLKETSLQSTFKRMISVWKQKHLGWDKNEDLKVSFANFTAFMSGIGKLVPSEYSFGQFDEMNDWAFEYYFEQSGANQITADSKPDNLKTTTTNWKIFSNKYKFGTNGDIIGLTDTFLKLSGTKIINPGTQVSLPQPPSQFSEENFNSRPGSQSVDDTRAVMGYQMYVEIDGTKTYEQLLSGTQPLPAGTIIPRTKQILLNTQDPIQSLDIKLLPSEVGKTFNTTNWPQVISYVNTKLRSDGYKLVEENTITVKVIRGVQSHTVCESVQDSNGYTSHTTGCGTAIDDPTIIYEFTWKETPIIATQTIPSIKMPSQIDLATWSEYENNVNNTGSVFEIVPVTKFGQRNDLTSITDITTKITLSTEIAISTKLEIISVDVEKSENQLVTKQETKDITFKWQTSFNEDQTVTQEGIRL